MILKLGIFLVGVISGLVTFFVLKYLLNKPAPIQQAVNEKCLCGKNKPKNKSLCFGCDDRYNELLKVNPRPWRPVPPREQ